MNPDLLPYAEQLSADITELCGSVIAKGILGILEGVVEREAYNTTRTDELLASTRRIVKLEKRLFQMQNAAIDLSKQLAVANESIAELEKSESQLIRERDCAEEQGTKLANAVSEFFRVPIGEHSSANDPRKVALDVLDGVYQTDSDTDRQLSAEREARQAVENDAAIRNELSVAVANNVRAFRNIETGEIRYVLFGRLDDNTEWEDVMIIPNISNEAIDSAIAQGKEPK